MIRSGVSGSFSLQPQGWISITAACASSTNPSTLSIAWYGSFTPLALIGVTALNPASTCRWKNRWPFRPSGWRTIEIGRCLMCGSIRSAAISRWG